jgi:hypothetical protein
MSERLFDLTVMVVFVQGVLFGIMWSAQPVNGFNWQWGQLECNHRKN